MPPEISAAIVKGDQIRVSTSTWIKRAGIVLLGVVIMTLGLIVPQLVQAESHVASPSAQWVVNTAIDENDGSCSDGDCSLRDAIAVATNGDNITFADDYAIYLNSTLEVHNSMTIDGSGHTVKISGDSGGDGTPNVLVLYIHLDNAVTLTHLSVVSGTTPYYGGGIVNLGALTLQNSTISGNSSGLLGGGLYNYGTLIVRNSTFSDNSSEQGGGIYNYYYSSLTMNNSTLTGNSALWGGGICNDSGAMSLSNTLIANSPSGGDCRNVDGGIASDHNLIEDTGDSACGMVNGANGNIVGVDPLLAPLGDYGGATQTASLLPGSPAINAGNSATCLAGDQRGVARPQGPGCDIGAIESRGFTLAVTGGSGQSTPGGAWFPDPLELAVSSSFGEAVDGGWVAFTGPASGAGIEPAVHTATIGSGGAVTQAVRSNSVMGSYTVSANTIGSLGAASFGLTNLAPNMAVMGNGMVIADGDAIPSPDDHTDFGSVTISGAITRTFTISNSGWLTLTINSLSLSGAGAGDFALSGLTTPMTLSKNSTATFQVRFESITVGVQPATVAVAISTDDGYQTTYDFAIQGRCLCVDHIQVSNVNDSGLGSLRWAMDSACDGGMVDFAGDYTIYLDSQLELTKTLTIDGSDHTVTVSGDSGGDGTPNVRVFYISSGGVVTLTHLNIVSGTISGNDGGGIHNIGGTLVVRNSTLSGNTAGKSGGGIYNIGGMLTVQNSTFSGNSAKWGGGLFNNVGTLTVQNSILSGNSASDSGGGVYNQSSSTATVQNSTLSDNAAPSGGGLYNNDGALHLYNALIANSLSGGDCVGSVNTNDHNLIEDVGGAACDLTNGAGGSIIGADPLLAPRGDYGGAMPTFALLPGSPALDAGNNGACLAADQRGVDRPQGGVCDIGAFESHGFTLTYVGGSDQSAPGYTSFPDPLGLTVAGNMDEPLDGGRVFLTGPVSGTGLYSAVYAVAIAGGAVSQTVWANGATGSYTVSADMPGNLGAAVNFTLTNLAPKMTVLGNGFIILDGDAVPSPDDGTDFGSLDVGGVVTHTFTISNCSSTASLTITGLSLSGADAGDFAFSGLTTPVTLPPTGTVPFQVRFVPTAVGTRSATVIVSNDGGPESDYDFAIQSTDVCAHRMSVTNSNDDGPGSLRYAIDRACVRGTVDFTGSYTVYLNSQLDLTKSLTIDGSGHTITLSGDSGGDGSPNVQVLFIGSGSYVTLTHLAVVNAAYGGVYNQGILTAQHCTFSGNSYGAGGAITNHDTVVVQACTFSGNQATINYGGAIVNYGSLVVQDSIFSGNSAKWGGGGIYNWSDRTATVENSVFSGNRVVESGTDSSGGGILNAGTLTLRNSTLSGNSAHLGGGMYSYDTSIVQNSIFSGNVAGGSGGGLFSNKTSYVQNCTFSGNVAHFSGGGIYNAHGMNVRNSTFSGNSADSQGGGIYNAHLVSLPGEQWLTVQNSTFSGNSANQGGGGMYTAFGSRLHMYNTLIANSSRGGDCYNNAHTVLFTYNLIEGNGDACGLTNGVDGNIVGVDPLLGPLADNGGPLAGLGQAIFTHALLPGSPALDAAKGGDCLPTDQRGVARPQGLDCDIGAFEAQSILSLAKWVAPAVDVPYHSAVTYTIVLSNTGAISDTAVLLTDTLPVGVAFGGWLENPGAVEAGNVITWTGVLTTQTVLTLTFTAVHTGDYGDVVTNTASFSGAAQTGHAAAAFSVVPTHTLTVRLDGSGLGAVNSEPAGIACGELCAADYGAGTVITLTAAPLVSSTFAGWSGAVVTGSNPVTVTLDADKTVTATFALKSYAITPTAGTGGSITPSAPQTVEYGGNIAFTIAPENGYHIADVGVDGVSQGALTSYAFNNVTANHTLSATFALNEYTLAVGTNGQGQVTRVPDQTTYPHGSVVTLTATPAQGWYFGQWSGDASGVFTQTTVLMDANKIVTATFVNTPQIYYTLTLSLIGSGFITPTVGAHPYLSGTVVPLRASPAEGWQFFGWSGAVDCADGSVTMNVNKHCTAIFARYQLYLPLVLRQQ